jgi:endonuclease I
MRFSIFSSALTGYLASRVPCPLQCYTWSREHVIPKSLRLPRNVTEHPRNIIPMPAKLNNARGSRPFTSAFKDGYVVYACDKCPMPGYCGGASVVSPDGVHPPNAYKGVIARSVLHSAFEHPAFAREIDKKVLELNTAIKWDRMFPMSEAEAEWIRSLN